MEASQGRPTYAWVLAGCVAGSLSNPILKTNIFAILMVFLPLLSTIVTTLMLPLTVECYHLDTSTPGPNYSNCI